MRTNGHRDEHYLLSGKVANYHRTPKVIGTTVVFRLLLKTLK